jgi:hypothetical protein
MRRLDTPAASGRVGHSLRDLAERLGGMASEPPSRMMEEVSAVEGLASLFAAREVSRLTFLHCRPHCRIKQ